MATVAHPATLSPAQARELFRNGMSRPTTGWCGGFAQANLMSVPADWAYDFLLFCQRNPKPCPLLDVTDPGARCRHARPGRRPADRRAALPRLPRRRAGRRADRRRRSMARRPGRLPASAAPSPSRRPCSTPGCRCATSSRAATCRCTARSRMPAGRAVSRPAGRLDAADPGRPGGHGDPRRAADARGPRRSGPLRRPRRPGHRRPRPPRLRRSGGGRPGEVPVFWACGVTPQAALMASRPPFAITHAPGYMLITDARDTDYRVG